MREPSAWALQVQLEKEERRVGELEDENRALKARVAQLEAERYQRVSMPVAERLFRSASADFTRAYRDGYTQFDQPLQAEFEQSLQAFAQPTKAPSPAPPPAAVEPSAPPPPTRWELLELD